MARSTSARAPKAAAVDSAVRWMALQQEVCGGFVVGPEGAVEDDLVRNDVARMSTGHPAEGEDGGLRGVTVPADHRLQCGDHVGRSHHGVDRAVGQGGVPAAADNADADFVGCGHVGPAAEADVPASSCG